MTIGVTQGVVWYIPNLLPFLTGGALIVLFLAWLLAMFAVKLVGSTFRGAVVVPMVATLLGVTLVIALRLEALILSLAFVVGLTFAAAAIQAWVLRRRRSRGSVASGR